MLKNIKSLKILTKKEQKDIIGANINPLSSCEAQATVVASIKANEEYFFEEFYNIYYQIAYENCINNTWES